MPTAMEDIQSRLKARTQSGSALSDIQSRIAKRRAEIGSPVSLMGAATSPQGAIQQSIAEVATMSDADQRFQDFMFGTNPAPKEEPREAADLSLIHKGLATGTADTIARTIRGTEAARPDIRADHVEVPEFLRPSKAASTVKGQSLLEAGRPTLATGQKQELFFSKEEQQRDTELKNKARLAILKENLRRMAVAKEQATARFLKAKENADWVRSFVPAEWKQAVNEANQKDLLGGDVDSINAWIATISQQVPVIAETFGARIIGGTVGSVLGPGGTIAGQTAAGVGAMSLLESGAFVESGERLGLDPDIIRQYAAYYGPGAGAIEYAQNVWLGKSFGRSKVIKGKAAKFTIRALKELGGWTWEGVEELSQNTLENFFLQKAVGDHNLRYPDRKPITAPQLGEGGLKSFVSGVGIAVVTRGFGKGFRSVKDSVTGKESEIPPKVGDIVETDKGEFTVTNINQETGEIEGTPVETEKPTEKPSEAAVSPEAVEPTVTTPEPVEAEPEVVVPQEQVSTEPVAEGTPPHVSTSPPGKQFTEQEIQQYEQVLEDTMATADDRPVPEMSLEEIKEETQQFNDVQVTLIDNAGFGAEDVVMKQGRGFTAAENARHNELEDELNKRGREARGLPSSKPKAPVEAVPEPTSAERTRGRIDDADIAALPKAWKDVLDQVDKEGDFPFIAAEYGTGTLAGVELNNKPVTDLSEVSDSDLQALKDNSLQHANSLSQGRRDVDSLARLLDRLYNLRLIRAEQERRVLGEAVPRPQAPAAAVGTTGGAEVVEKPTKPKPTPKPEEPDITTTTKAFVAKAREKRGDEPFVQPEPESKLQWVSEAKAKIEDEPTWIPGLAIELSINPRPLTPTERAGLQVVYRTATTAWNIALDKLKAAQANNGDIEAARRLADQTRAEMRVIEAASNAAKRLWGQTGGAMQIALNVDYSIERMIQDAEHANNGKPLSNEQLLKLREQSKQIEKMQAQIDVLEKNASDKAIKKGLQKVIKQASKKGVFSDTAASEAMKRIMEKFSAESLPSNMIFDVELLKDLGIVLGNKIAKGVKTLADATRAILHDSGLSADSDAGKRLAQYAKEAWKKDETQKALNQVKKGNVVASSEDVAEGIKQSYLAGKPLSGMHRAIHQLAESFVAEGIKDPIKLADAVHRVLREIDPNVTGRIAMEGIVGYGIFTPLNKDQTKAELRDARGQLHQVLKLLDMQEGQAPPRTGQEHRKPSNKERRLEKKVNQIKRQAGFVVIDPETQLKSALDSIKTRLENEIADLEMEIATGQLLVKTKTTVERDAAAKALEARRDALKAIKQEIFGKPGLTDEQRIERAIKSTQRSIAELDRRIKDKDLFPKKGMGVTSPALQAERAKRDARRQELKALQDLADIEDPSRKNAIHNSQFAARVAKRIAELEDKLARRDYAPRTKKDVPLTTENKELQIALDQIKFQVEKDKFKMMRENRTALQQAYDLIPEASGVSRSIMTSFDVSALGRQGFLAFLGHPLMVGKDTKGMMQALLSKKARIAIDIALRERAIAPLAKQAGLAITERGGKLEAMEEVYSSRLVELIPGVAASERAYSTMLNLIRMDMFESLMASAGGNVTLAEAKALANFVNVWTGRGNISRKGLATALLSLPLFSARLTASRFQVLLGQPLWRGTKRTRLLIAKEYLRTAVGMGIMYGIIHMGIKLMWDDDDEDKPTIELDPRSSDFLKIKWGNTRVDPMAGLSQTAVFLSRMAPGFLGGGKTKSLSGAINPLSGPEVTFGRRDRADVAVTFLRTKLNPLAGAAWTLATGKDFKGDEPGLGEIGLNMVTPMVIGDAIDAGKDMGIKKGAVVGLIAALGVSTQTHLREGKSGYQSEKAELNFKKKQAKLGKGKHLTDKETTRLGELKSAGKKVTAKKKEIKRVEALPESEADRKLKIADTKRSSLDEESKKNRVEMIGKLAITSKEDKNKQQDTIRAEIAKIYNTVMAKKEN